MGRGNKIKHIPKNGYSKFKQVLVKVNNKESFETTKEPESSENTKIPQSSEIPKNLESSDITKKPERSLSPKKLESSETAKKPRNSESNKKSENSETPKEHESFETFKKSEDSEISDSFETTKKNFESSKMPRKPRNSGRNRRPDNSEQSKKPQSSVTPKRSEAPKNSQSSDKTKWAETPKKPEISEKPKLPETPKGQEKAVKLEAQNRIDSLQKPDILEKPEIPKKSENPEKHETPPILQETKTSENPQKLETLDTPAEIIKLPEEYLMKHPLEYSWGMWLITNDKRNWEDNLVKLTSFDTVEDYWCLYHHMKTPSELGIGKDYAVFKKEFRPMWEDPANRAGGRWVISFDKKRNENSDLDFIWVDLVLLMIGENFPDPSAICGAVVNVRAKSRIAIWVSDYKNEHAIMQVGKTMRNALRLKGRLSFQQHNTTKSLFVF